MPSCEVKKMLVIALITFFMSTSFVLMTGCAVTGSSQSTPFKLGEEVAPPAGCIDLRKRGGSC